MDNKVSANNVVKLFRRYIGDFITAHDVHRLLNRYKCTIVGNDKRGTLYLYDDADNFYENPCVVSILNKIINEIENGTFVFDEKQKEKDKEKEKDNNKQLEFNFQESKNIKKVFLTEKQINHIIKHF